MSSHRDFLLPFRNAVTMSFRLCDDQPRAICHRSLLDERRRECTYQRELHPSPRSSPPREERARAFRGNCLDGLSPPSPDASLRIGASHRQREWWSCGTRAMHAGTGFSADMFEVGGGAGTPAAKPACKSLVSMSWVSSQAVPSIPASEYRRRHCHRCRSSARSSDDPADRTGPSGPVVISDPAFTRCSLAE